MTIVNESGDDGEGKGQNQDLDPGSRAYRDDDEVRHTGMTGILNLRGLKAAIPRDAKPANSLATEGREFSAAKGCKFPDPAPCPYDCLTIV